MADPIYRQIADDLRHQIETGELQPGSQLKTEAQLQEEYSGIDGYTGNVSRNTVRDAVQLLVGAGLVEKRPGQGTFVVEKIDPFVTTLSGNPEGGETAAYRSEVARRGRQPQETKPRVEIHEASAAPELNLEEGAEVVSRHQARRIDGKPYSLQTSFYPRSFTKKAPLLDKAGEIEEGAVAYIRRTYGVKQAGWREAFRVRAPDGTETAFFNLPAKGGIPVIEARRTAFDESGVPTRLTVTVYPADRNILVYETGKVPQQTESAVPNRPNSGTVK